MTDRAHPDRLAAELPPDVVALLARPELWEPAPELADSILAEINAVVPLAEARRRRDARAVPRWLGAAAAVALVTVGAVVVARSDDDAAPSAEGVPANLDGTDLAPEASATATIAATPAGLRIVLDAEGLPGAGPDEMYEAWVGNGTIRVSAGTFHLRSGDDPIALWAGVTDPAFGVLTVTLEPLDGVAESSGEVVLRGEFEMP